MPPGPIQAFSREDPSVLVDSVDSATSAVTSMKEGLRCDDVASVLQILKVDYTALLSIIEGCGYTVHIDNVPISDLEVYLFPV